MAATLAPDERASLVVRATRFHDPAGWSQSQFGAGAGVGGVRGLMVCSLSLERVFLELRSTSLVVASRRGVWWRGEV